MPNLLNDTNLFAKVLKTLDILQTKCELIFEPTLRYFLFLMTSLLISETSCANKVDLIN